MLSSCGSALKRLSVLGNICQDDILKEDVWLLDTLPFKIKGVAKVVDVDFTIKVFVVDTEKFMYGSWLGLNSKVLDHESEVVLRHVATPCQKIK